MSTMPLITGGGEPPAGSTGTSPSDIRRAEDEIGVDIIRWHRKPDGSVEMTVAGPITPAQTRDLANRFGDEVSITVERAPAEGSSNDSDGSTSAGSQGSGAAGGGTPSPTSAGGGAPSTADNHDHADEGTLNRVPEGAEVWKVGSTLYLAYKVPGTSIETIWQVEDDERLEAIFGTTSPPIDRTLTESQLRARAPWRGGLSRELSDLHVGADPWQQFQSDFEEAAELRPWLRDPSYQAINAIAYLEGRAPTTDELARTDWWNDHTEDERRWMESSATAGRAEVERRMQDAKEITAEALRNSGTDNAPQAVIDYIAMQRLTGKWSQEKANQQVRRLTDPSAPGNLDPGVWAAWRGDVGNATDARAIAEGKPAVMRRVRAIFDNANVPTTAEQLDRVADEVLNGRAFDDVRRSVDIARGRLGQTLPGLDTTRAEEDTVKALMQNWIGPQLAEGYGDEFVTEWAGKFRNNPDAEQELIELLRGARLANLPEWTNPNAKYSDIAPQARSLFRQVWGQVPDETDPFFLDILRASVDGTEAEKRLRKIGREKGVTKVIQDFNAQVGATPLGEQVVRSTV